MYNESVVRRFWEKVVRSNGCWLWRGAKSRGYGILSTKRGLSPAKAHRVSWFIHNGEIPSGMCVCHKCDNPECCNPDHLFLGTHKENMLDAYRKGRLKMYKHGRGLENNASTLTREEVSSIRADYTAGAKIKDLVEKYGHSNIPKIIQNKVYRDPKYKYVSGNKKKRPWRKVLSNKDVHEILKSTLSSRVLSERYGVSKTTILKVRRGDYG